MTDLLIARDCVNDVVSPSAANRGKKWTTQGRTIVESLYLEGLTSPAIAQRLGRTPRAIRHVLQSLGYNDNNAGIDGKTVVMPVTRAIEAVCWNFGVQRSDLLLRKRTPPRPQYRFLVCWLAKQVGAPILHIGRQLGFNHSTVLYGCRWVHKRRQAVPEYLAMSDRLLAEMRGQS